ncbi:MAG: class I SAM-dependent methyltransferase [Brevinematales bacterium]
MLENTRKRIVTPAGIELTLEAEKHVSLKKSDSLLSVGCGTGELESYLAEKYGSTVIGIDRDEELIRIASRKNLKNLHFFAGNGESLVYDDSFFDYIYSCGAVAAFFDRGVSEAYRVLKADGIFILIEVVFMGSPVPADVWNIWANRKIKVMTREGLLWELEKKGFKSQFSKVYYEPEWFKVYYEDRGDDPVWALEKLNYLKYREYIGIGLFILKKGPVPGSDLYQI